jgi:hypothetical protein
LTLSIFSPPDVSGSFLTTCSIFFQKNCSEPLVLFNFYVREPTGSHLGVLLSMPR